MGIWGAPVSGMSATGLSSTGAWAEPLRGICDNSAEEPRVPVQRITFHNTQTAFDGNPQINFGPQLDPIKTARTDPRYLLYWAVTGAATHAETAWGLRRGLPRPGPRGVRGG